MRKPKMICVAGSAILAPLTLASLTLLCIASLRVFWPPLAIPQWLGLTSLAGFLAMFPFVCAHFYHWYFDKCYQPSQR